MFTKFELLGITVSICAMILALYLVTVKDEVLTQSENIPQVATAQSGLQVVDSTGPDGQNSLRDALLNAAGPTGKLEKLVANDVRFGIGDPVKVGDTISVHYIGTLQNGFEFDNSHKRGTPFTFTVGEGKVIKGWEEGVIGMRVGGARILVIPPDMGYGKTGFGPIPPDAPLVFSIELLEIK